ncbi:unnamed protein product [Thlaspi arvense]|uniref:Retrotransposon Copia-like N-terminal domain-containing protein n=1 Tax=Thlaspi arvense TaxID=13288 RepID=A0AAU9REL9_THLAR|nr:unnamed protein product [Thlaspi arvense]
MVKIANPRNKLRAATTMAESKSDPTLEFGSPYYIDPDFHSTYSFQMEKLSQAEDNYVFWKIRFQALLRLADKIGFVDGTIEKPDPSSPLYQPWERCDSMVTLLLLNSMTEKLQKRVMFAGTAQKVWEKLRQIFVPNLDLKIYELRQRIAMLRQEGDSVARYFGKLRRAWAELSEYDPAPECACGGCRCEISKRAKEAREKEQCYAFMMGLNNGLRFVKTELRLMKPPPSLDKAYAMVAQAESVMKNEEEERRNLIEADRMSPTVERLSESSQALKLCSYFFHLWPFFSRQSYALNGNSCSFLDLPLIIPVPQLAVNHLMQPLLFHSRSKVTHQMF